METRLVVCSIYLNEVESELNEVLALPDNDDETKARIIEALAFVREARQAVTITRAARRAQA